MGLERAFYAARTYSWACDPRRLLPLRNVPIDRPIFLLGMQGNGLTLLSRMLRRHPTTISAAGGPGYWTSADELQNVYGAVLPFELTGLRYKAPPHPVLKAPRSWTYAVDELFPLYRKRASDATPALRRALERVIRYSALRHAGDDRHSRFVDKSQVFCVRAGLVHALLAQSEPQFVLMSRDPYVSVYRAATGKAGDMRRLAHEISYDQRIDICAQHYGNSVRAIYEDAESTGLRLYAMRYEDLLEHPREQLSSVCEFVGLDFRDDLLPAAHHRLPLGSRYRNRWYPLNTSANASYESRIDATTVEAVNRHVGDLVERLGYARRQSVRH